MSLTHDEMADIIAHTLLKKHREHFGNVFISPVSSDFPRPDFIFLPVEIRKKSLKKVFEEVLEKEKKSYPTAFEFKTPYVHKHEYIKGIGQAIAYNANFVRSYLIVPEYNMEGIDVISFVHEIAEKTKLSIGLISYDPNDLEKVEIVRNASILALTPESLEETIRGVTRSYAYWRETKPEEVYKFLKIAEEESLKSSPGEDLRNKILHRLWSEVLVKRFPRTRRKSAFLLNYRLFFSHLGLWDKSGRLTPLGKYTLIQGDRFGEDSPTFRDIIAYLLLKYGGHYTLLRKIYLEQKKMSDDELSSWETWIEVLENRLSERNFYISREDFKVGFPRLPYAYSKYFGGIVSEPYFVKGRGLNINWIKIIEILDKGRRIYSPLETD